MAGIDHSVVADVSRPSTMPLVVLGGSDGRPSRLPEQGREQHPISGYKGADVRIDGRPLAELVRQHALDCGAFGPVLVAGPSRIYAPIVGAEAVIDIDGTFGQNVAAAIRQMQRSYPATPVGFLSCDLLPSPDLLGRLAALHAADAPCDLWFPMVRAPDSRERLGASQWKPAYRVVPEPGAEPVGVLPGHMAIADIGGMRVDFLERLFDLGYRTRNRPVNERRRVMVSGVVGTLLYQDLRHLLGLRLPTLTWSVLTAGIAAAGELRDGCITRQRLERALRRVMFTSAHQRRYPERRVSTPIVDELSLALDIDTEEEARALGAELDSRTA